MRGDTGRIAIEDLRARLGSIPLTGTALWQAGEDRPHLKATLKAGEVTLNPLLPATKTVVSGDALAAHPLLKAMAEARRGAQKSPALKQTQEQTQKKNTGTTNRSSPPSPAGTGNWLVEDAIQRPPPVPNRRSSGKGVFLMPRPLWLASAKAPGMKNVADAPWFQRPFALLSAFDAELDLAAAAVAYDVWRVEGAHGQVTLKGGSMRVSAFTGTLFGGTLALTGSLDAAADTPKLAAVVEVKGADLRETLERIAGLRALEGRLDVNAEWAAQGDSPQAMGQALTGVVRFKGENGRVRGFDMAVLNRRLAAGDAIVLTPQIVGKGLSTPFRSLSGTIHVIGHVTDHVTGTTVRTGDLRMTGPTGQSVTVATLDWSKAEGVVRTEIWPSAFPDAPPVTVRADGSLAALRWTLDAAAFQRHRPDPSQTIDHHPTPSVIRQNLPLPN
ncbi:MAG: hypothetical protein FD149_798 [Rhodospirillaceae bacterium]|nr:MAG: hypothetical protein FD149_798 [Rhodospirillaceae bacterium]